MASTIDSLLRSHLASHRQALDAVTQQLSEQIVLAAEAVIGCLEEGGKLLILGNGGSAADAQHFAAELVGRYQTERGALPALALTTDSSILTAVGNDYGFDSIFARQVEALANPEDLVVVFSTSGQSANVIAAVKAAGASGCRCLGLLGKDGGLLRDLVDLALLVPAQQTAQVQEMHIMLVHMLCGAVDHHFSAQETH